MKREYQIVLSYGCVLAAVASVMNTRWVLFAVWSVTGMGLLLDVMIGMQAVKLPLLPQVFFLSAPLVYAAMIRFSWLNGLELSLVFSVILVFCVGLSMVLTKEQEQSGVFRSVTVAAVCVLVFGCVTMCLVVCNLVLVQHAADLMPMILYWMILFGLLSGYPLATVVCSRLVIRKKGARTWKPFPLNN